MPFQRDYPSEEPIRADIDAASGWMLIEFGAPWCPHCIAAQAPLAEALAARERETGVTIAHRKVEDGPGRPLGRSFRVKLWPTLILMRDGVEAARIVRPTQAGEIAHALFAP